MAGFELPVRLPCELVELYLSDRALQCTVLRIPACRGRLDVVACSKLGSM